MEINFIDSGILGLAIVISFSLFLSLCSLLTVINNDSDFKRYFLLRGLTFLGIMPSLVVLLSSLIIAYNEVFIIKINLIKYINKIIHRIGVFAFVLYVFHEPIYIAVRKLASPEISTYRAFQYLMIIIPLLTAFIYIFFNFIEQRFYKKIDNETRMI